MQKFRHFLAKGKISVKFYHLAVVLSALKLAIKSENNTFFFYFLKELGWLGDWN